MTESNQVEESSKLVSSDSSDHDKVETNVEDVQPLLQEDSRKARELRRKEEKSMGTSLQKEVCETYPTETVKQKLKVPYIEKINGNIYAKA